MKATTWDNWRAYTDAYVVPKLGDARLQQLTASQLMAFYSRLLTEGRVDHNVRMFAWWSTQVKAGAEPTPREFSEACDVTIHAARTRRRAQVPVGAVPRPAARGTRAQDRAERTRDAAPRSRRRRQWHYINDNPAAHARAPKVTRQRRTVWTPADLALFLTVARDNRFFPLFALVATTGMRRGELCGLHWPRSTSLRVCSRCRTPASSSPVAPRTPRARRTRPDA